MIKDGKIKPDTIEFGFKNILEKHNLLNLDPPTKKLKKTLSDEALFSDEAEQKIFDTSEQHQQFILKTIKSSQKPKRKTNSASTFTAVDIDLTAEPENLGQNNFLINSFI